MKRYLEASQMFTPTGVVRSPRIAIEDGRFALVGTRQDTELPASAVVEDFGDAILAPGFIDLHIHGSGGHDVMEGTPEALKAVESRLATTGVTAYLATTVTAPVDRTTEAIQKLGAWTNATKTSTNRAVPLGLHLEGPFISHAKRGVHPQDSIQPPSIELLEKFVKASQGTVRLMTVAPEGVGAAEMIRHAATNGITVSVGHSNATYEETRRSIDAGARHATHTFNAMRALDHREPGILGAVLADTTLSAEIIADGIHVHPEMVKMFVQAKGLEKSVLVTDAISATGMGDGTYQLGGFQVTVRGERCESENRLAGSVLTLDRAVRNVCRFANVELWKAVRFASYNPARLLGLKDRGEIKAGYLADLNVVSTEGAIRKTLLAGL